MALIDSIVIRYIRFLTVVMYSSQLSNCQLLFIYLILFIFQLIFYL